MGTLYLKKVTLISKVFVEDTAASRKNKIQILYKG